MRQQLALPALVLAAASTLVAANPLARSAQQAGQAGQTTQTGQAGQRGAAPQTPAGAQRGGGRGRGGVQIMTLATSAWQDSAMVPLPYTQGGAEMSPPLFWMNAPDTAVSFALVVHDLDAPVGNGNDDLLHWLVWNIPGAARQLQEHMPQGAELPDGTRQISATGPYYRGPAAPASGEPHHYVFELFALDTKLDVKPVGASPAETRAAVVAAMTGHIRGKGVLLGRFRYPPT
jgi:hypothetical protein